MKEELQIKTKEHFDRIAGDYDGYKRKNWYYYENIKKILAGVIAEPHRKRILDIGCGTGEILGFLDPLWGVGIDISENMIEIARNKFKGRNNLHFQAEDIQKHCLKKDSYDYMLMIDIIEHLPNIEEVFAAVKNLAGEDTKIIISSLNHRWNWIWHFAERMGLKMPEGPHQWVDFDYIFELLRGQGFEVQRWGGKLLLPVHIFMVSRMINSISDRLDFTRKMRAIQYLVVKLSSRN